MNHVRILLADDHELVRRGLRALMEAEDGWEVVGEAVTGREAVEKAKKLKPDVVVMDISMPSLNGLEATRQIRKAVPQAEVLILTIHESDELIREILDTGARGYVLKSDSERDLAIAVRALSQHKPFFTSQVTELLLGGYRKGTPEASEGAGKRSLLTAREREITQLLAEGKSSKEVAVALNISVKTAETHRAHIMRKLDLHSVSELVRYAIRNKIIEP
jgi:DNA-binding NarL/FixJ family response regulator